jgi:plasmid stabilization system protein ParE
VRIESIEFHHEATAEYDAAFDWYLDRSADAAIEFDAEVDRALAQISAAPRRWAAGPFSTRRFLLQRFPFTLIYRELALGNIQIVAVAHTSRKPGYWKRRM